MKTPTITISVRLKPEELNVIEEKAKEAGMNRNCVLIFLCVYNGMEWE